MTDDLTIWETPTDRLTLREVEGGDLVLIQTGLDGPSRSITIPRAAISGAARQNSARRHAAYELRDRLKAEGRSRDAQIITDLGRSAASSASLNKILQRGLEEALGNRRRDV